MIGKFVIVRSDKAGVVCGYLTELTDHFVTLTEVRQIWRWAGAETTTGLSQCGASLTVTTRIDKASPKAMIPVIDIAAILECTPVAEENLRQERWL